MTEYVLRVSIDTGKGQSTIVEMSANLDVPELASAGTVLKASQTWLSTQPETRKMTLLSSKRRR